MTTVTGLTAARMLDIEQNSIVDGSVVGDNLILEKQNGQTIDAGNVRGPEGPAGASGAFLFSERFDGTLAGYTEVPGSHAGVLGINSGRLTLSAPTNTGTPPIHVRNNVSEKDSVQMFEIKSGATPGAGALNVSLLARYLDASNYLMATANVETATSVRIKIYKNDAGVVTALNAAAGAVGNFITASGTYWLVTRVVGNFIQAEWWDIDPRLKDTAGRKLLDRQPLPSGDIAKFGKLVSGSLAYRIFAAADSSYDDHFALKDGFGL